MKMRVFSALVALGLIPIAGQAQVTVNYGAYVADRNVTDTSGTPLVNNNTVEIGYFNSSFNIAANAGNLSLLSANWHLFGSTPITTLFGEPGRFAGVSTVNDAQFDNQHVALWIFDTGGAPVAGDFSNVRSYGLFSDATWIFPVHDAVPPGNSITITSSDTGLQAYHGSILGDATTGSLQLAAVPEPHTLALVGLAFGVAIIAIRRPRS